MLAWPFPSLADSHFVDAEDFQPGRMFLGCVPDKVRAIDIALRRSALGEIYETHALRTQDIHTQT
jgi:hypothetical protein